MAVDQERIAEGVARLVDEIGQGAVIGAVDRLDPGKRIG